MIIAYGRSAKQMAMELKKPVLPLRPAAAQGGMILLFIKPAQGLLNLVEANENGFLLNITGLCAREVARIFRSRIGRPFGRAPSDFKNQ